MTETNDFEKARALLDNDVVQLAIAHALIDIAKTLHEIRTWLYTESTTP